MGLLEGHEGGLTSLLGLGKSERDYLAGMKNVFRSRLFRDAYLKSIYNELGILPYGAFEIDGKIFPPETKKVVQKKKKTKLVTGDVLYERELFHPNAQGIDGIRILVMSDFHFDHLSNQNKRIQCYMDALSEKEFDLAFVVGDMVQGGNTNIEVNFFKSINPGLGKYFVLGNHDYYEEEGSSKIREQMQKADFIDLTNKAISLEYEGNNISVSGLDDPILGNPEYTQQLEEVNREQFNILMVHALDGLTSEVPNKFDFVVSGHYHSGEFDFGIVDGIDWLLIEGRYLNLNHHKRGSVFLTNRTLSYIDPGASAHFKERYRIPRIMTETQGISIITLRN